MMMMLQLIIKLKLRQQQQQKKKHSPTSISLLLPLRRLTCCRINDPKTTRPTTEPISAAAAAVDDPETTKKKKLLDGILTAEGSLGDMEATLQRQLQGLRLTPSLLTHAIRSCSSSSSSSRRLLRFFSWCRQQHKGQEQEESSSFNQVIRALAEMRDLTAMQLAISDFHKEDNAKMDTETFACAAKALIRSGRANEAVHLFRQQHLPPRGGQGGSVLVTAIVHALCEKGHVREAKCIAWRHRDKLQGEEEEHHHHHQRGIVLRSLLHGWCVHRNVREARRTMDEMRSLDILPGHAAYHDLLRCVCNRNLKFNPSALVPEATDVMAEMRRSGVPVTAVTYNILLSSLGRTRRVKESCRILDSMEKGERGDSPLDRVSYYLVARVLYLTRRFGRGHAVVDRMSRESAAMPNPSAAAAASAMGLYHDLIGVLCGMNEVGHALHVFNQMKKACWGQEENNWRPTYDMLIAKLCRSGKFEIGRELLDEAVGKGVFLRWCSEDFLDPLSSLSSKTLVSKPVEKLKNTNHHNTIVQKRRRATLGVKKEKRRLQYNGGREVNLSH